MDLLFEGHGLQDLVDGGLPQLGSFASGQGQDGGGKKEDSFHSVYQKIMVRLSTKIARKMDYQKSKRGRLGIPRFFLYL
jgi:hypothetical protein